MTSSAGLEPVNQPQMRITEVRIHSLEAWLRERFGWSLNWTDRRTTTLVEVKTDSGLTGWVEGAAVPELLDRPGAVIGRSPFEVEAIYDEMRRPAGHQRRPGPPPLASKNSNRRHPPAKQWSRTDQSSSWGSGASQRSTTTQSKLHSNQRSKTSRSAGSATTRERGISHSVASRKSRRTILRDTRRICSV